LFYDSTKQAYVLLLNQIALSFLGLLKIPPNGATAFYLFGDAVSSSSALGWYAIYNNEPKKTSPALSEAETDQAQSEPVTSAAANQPRSLA